MATQTAVAPLTVRKRSGKVVDYKQAKIEQAIRLCLVNGCRRNDDDATRALAKTVADRVQKIIKKMTGPVSVEAIQDLAEQVLMGLDERDAAIQYMQYREEHKKLREAAEIDPAAEQAIREDIRNHFVTDAQVFQHYDKYARFNDVAKRRETFEESTDRQISFLRWEVEVRHGRKGVISEAEWAMLRRYLIRGEATPSMRLQQTAGPAATRCNVGIYNCSFAGLKDLDYFHEGLYISMQGTGHAFSCEGEFVEQLPQIKPQRKGYTPDHYMIPDTTEGWCESVRDLSIRLFEGHDLQLDYSEIEKGHPAGAKLRTKGGTASGPKPLMDLHVAMRRLILPRQGRRLRDIDAHDWMCWIGGAGQMGGFRRAAELSLSDLNSLDMRMAKFGEFWKDPAKLQRTISNNSAAYNEKPDPYTFLDEWVSLAKSKSGERGIFNRGSIVSQFPERRRQMYQGQNVLWGTNPCGEIILHPDGQFCNLSIANCRPSDTETSLMAKVEIAAIFGTLQSMLTTFNYIRPRWKENCERERLLGVSLDGALDCPLLRDTNPDRERLLGRLRQRVVETNQKWAVKLNIPVSTATTCMKPGGNSSVRWNVGQAMSGWLTEHMIRNVEVGNHNPMCRFLKDQGVPHELSYRDPSTTVFSFLLKAPEGANIVADLVTDANGNVVGIKPRRCAIDQLNDWLAFKKNFTEHNPSVSIYVNDNEWLQVGQWVQDHWEDVGGLAFFPLDGGVYPQAPMQPVTPERFAELSAAQPKIAWEKLPRYEGGRDHTERPKELACSGKDGCMLN